MANTNKAETERNTSEPTQCASAGEEVRTSSVTAGTNGGTSNRPDYQPEESRISPDEPGGTQSHSSNRK